jgi:hypothetical protein
MNDLSRRRDPRIDFFRGLALVMIFINHIPDTVPGLYTSRNFGFSDAAEGFVLLSGISAGLAYSPIRSANRGLANRFRPWRRAFTLWWVQAVIVLSIYLLLRLALPLPGVAEMAAARNVTPVLDDPAGSAGAPAAADPPVQLRRHPAAVHRASAGRAGADRGGLAMARGPAGRLGPAVAGRRMARGEPAHLAAGHRLVLQSAGLAIPVLDRPGQSALRASKGWKAGVLCGTVAVLPAVAFLAVSLLWMQSPALADRGQAAACPGPGAVRPARLCDVSRQDLSGPLAPAAHPGADACAGLLPVVTRIAHSQWAAPLTILGRNALPAFAAASILGYVIQVVREFFIPSDLVDAVAIAVGLNAMLLVALLRDRQRHPTRRPGAMVSG